MRSISAWSAGGQYIEFEHALEAVNDAYKSKPEKTLLSNKFPPPSIGSSLFSQP